MNVLITGGNSKLGVHLCEEALRLGHAVSMTTRRKKSTSVRIPTIPLDLSQPNCAESLLQELKNNSFAPDLLVLNAADTTRFRKDIQDLRTYHRVNTDSQLEIAEALHNTYPRIKIVFVSSILAHFRDDFNPEYHRSKAQTEAGMKQLANRLPQGSDIQILAYGPLTEQPSVIPFKASYSDAAAALFQRIDSNQTTLFYPKFWEWLLWPDRLPFSPVSRILTIFR